MSHILYNIRFRNLCLPGNNVGSDVDIPLSSRVIDIVQGRIPPCVTTTTWKERMPEPDDNKGQDDEQGRGSRNKEPDLDPGVHGHTMRARHVVDGNAGDGHPS